MLKPINVLLRRLPEPPLEVEALMAEARRSAGLHDFGDESFREPLEVLVESIEREARLHPLGRRITRGRLVGVLRNRLRVHALLERHPEVRAETVRAPIVVAGVQRTGTTLLHRVLAAHPGLRALASWEALHPAPARRQLPFGPDPRLLDAKLAEWGLRVLAPDFFAIHPVQATAPEEDVLLLDQSLLSTVPEATLRVPTYSRWLESRDPTPAYAYMKILLGLLQWQRHAAQPPGRWVLKTPHHLEWLDVLFAVFPDAVVVQTHRDPTVTLASFCSMIAHGRAVFSDAVDRHEIGREWSRKVRRMVERAMATRDRSGEDRFVDVRYRDLVADPMAQVRRIAERAHLPLTPEAEERMRRTLSGNPQHKHGVHRYRLEDYGLRRDEVERTFADYRERFAIPSD
ncbi:MAG: sulfotransferase family protein [Myxococcota bacterium]